MRDLQHRRRIALEAARLICEQGMRDPLHAARKAAARLGGCDPAHLPRAAEIEAAVQEHQRLFQPSQPARLRQLREAAIAAMRFFSRFEPRLVGAVLEGTADAHSAVSLHLYCDTPEQVLGWLDEHGIVHAQHGRRLRVQRDITREFPSVRLTQDGIEFDLTLLPTDALRQAALQKGSEQPMRRARLSEVEALLGEAQLADGNGA